MKTKKKKRTYIGNNIVNIRNKETIVNRNPIKIKGCNYDTKVKGDYSNLELELEENETETVSETETETNDFYNLEFNKPNKIECIEPVSIVKPKLDLNYVKKFICNIKNKNKNKFTDKYKCNNKFTNKYNNKFTNNLIYTNVYGIETPINEELDDILYGGADDNSQLAEIQINNFYNEIAENAYTSSPQLKTLHINYSDLYVIHSKAFYKCSSLENVVINSDSIIIENCAFAFCLKLKSIELKNVLRIGDNCFHNSGLEHISLTNSLNYIGFGCFKNSKLKSIELPRNNNFNIIPNECFMNCQLEYIEIPNTISVIKKDAFKNNRNLRMIILPNDIRTIESGAFKNLDDNTMIVFRKNAKKSRRYGCFITIGRDAFEIHHKRLEEYIEKYICVADLILHRNKINVSMNLNI